MALTVREVEPDVWITASRSIEHLSCPARPGVVRGHSSIAGLELRRNQAGGTDVTYIACVDPKVASLFLSFLDWRTGGCADHHAADAARPRQGWLPHWAVNIGAGKGAMCIDFLRQYVLKGERAQWAASE